MSFTSLSSKETWSGTLEFSLTEHKKTLDLEWAVNELGKPF